MRLLYLTIALLCSCNYQNLKNVSSEPIPLEPKFASLKANIFDIKCQECHRLGGRGEAILFESKEELLKSLEPIIIPGEPENSKLVQSLLEGAKKPMPPLRVRPRIAPVAEAELNAIIEWIKNGAID